MANWTENVTTKKADEINATASLQSTMDNRQRTGRMSEESIVLSDALKTIDVIGINTAKISEMVSAIQSYTKAVQTHLDGIDPTTNANAAFQGKEVQDAVKAYVNQVKTYCKNLVSQLNAFCDKLIDIKETYIANKEELASNIKTEAGFDAGSNYSYKKAS